MKQQNIYIGNSSTKGIYQYTFKNGELLKSKKQIKSFEKCTYITTSKRNLYSVIEKEKGMIVQYKKEQSNLIYKGKISSYGKGPCHIEISPNKKLLFISNYIDGYYTIYKLNKDGSIKELKLNKVEDKNKSHSHCIKIASNGKFFYVVDLGADLLIAYEIKNNKIKEIDKLKLENNTQPRHIITFKNTIYLITEKSCKLYTIKLKNKKLKILEEQSLLPKNVKIQENYTGCAIKASKNYKYIYTTIRGHNSISVFKKKDKKIELVQNIDCRGELPWDITLDKSENYVFIANNKSNKISIFKRNKKTGILEYKNSIEMESPTCVAIDR